MLLPAPRARPLASPSGCAEPASLKPAAFGHPPRHRATLRPRRLLDGVRAVAAPLITHLSLPTQAFGALALAAAVTGFMNQPAPPQPVLREAMVVNVEESTFFDVGLDDASIPFDEGITAARKCGFCMG